MKQCEIMANIPEQAEIENPLADKQKCVCCGQLKAKKGFLYCYGCHKKWLWVYDCYINAGFDDERSKKAATKAYPPKYGPNRF